MVSENILAFPASFFFPPCSRVLVRHSNTFASWRPFSTTMATPTAVLSLTRLTHCSHELFRSYHPFSHRVLHDPPPAALLTLIHREASWGEAKLFSCSFFVFVSFHRLSFFFFRLWSSSLRFSPHPSFYIPFHSIFLLCLLSISSFFVILVAVEFLMQQIPALPMTPRRLTTTKAEAEAVDLTVWLIVGCYSWRD